MMKRDRYCTTCNIEVEMEIGINLKSRCQLQVFFYEMLAILLFDGRE